MPRIKPPSADVIAQLAEAVGAVGLPPEQMARLVEMTRRSYAAAATLPLLPKDHEPALIFDPLRRVGGGGEP
jgi:hypothetical protein